MEDNIFARASESSSAESSIPSNMRARSSSKPSLFINDNYWKSQSNCSHDVIDVLGRVEAEQNRWMKKVEEQRKNIFEDHTMLN